MEKRYREPEYVYVVTNVATNTPWLAYKTEARAIDYIDRNTSSIAFRIDVVRVINA